ncbi:MAG TPA: RNA polymerase sigma factor [Solirubrobacteraceae bacterium]|jgi:RNA polymerase sigma-70 factor (ECF subfamily)|nr:RNA polymerase sigma factor [Solirubrobacteraceae bacterium]
MTSLPDHARRARFERLYDAHYAPVLAYALRRSERSVAHDVAAETFLVAWRRLDDVPADAAPWLYGVARRVLANERRGAGRRAALAERLRQLPARRPPGEALEGAGSGSLAEALARLPERDREALMLVAWEGLSTAQAARAMGCAPAALRVRLHRARRRLARALDDLQSPHAPQRQIHEPTEEAAT